MFPHGYQRELLLRLLKSPGERGSGRSRRQLIRNARYVLYVEMVCYLYLPHAHSVGQPLSGRADLWGSRQAAREYWTAPFGSTQLIQQILGLLSGLGRYQTYRLGNLSYCKMLNDQASFNSKAELKDPPPHTHFKLLDSKKKGENSLYFDVSIHWSKVAKYILIVCFSRKSKNWVEFLASYQLWEGSGIVATTE